MATENWRELPLDVAIIIIEKLKFYENVEAFSEVCSSWRCAAKLAKRSSSSTQNQTPWLMLAEAEEPCTLNRQFYSLYDHRVRQRSLPSPPTILVSRMVYEQSSILYHPTLLLDQYKKVYPPKEYNKEGNWRYFSSRGWLICVTQIGLNVTLVHPFSGHIIQTPAIPLTILRDKVRLDWHDRQYLHIFNKFALSDCPLTTQDFTLAMIISDTMAFWRSNDDEWTTAVDWIDNQQNFKDAIFYQGQFYAVHCRVSTMQVVAFNWNLTPMIVASLRNSFLKKVYLVDAQGMLLFVSRVVVNSFDDENVTINYKTDHFKVWEVNLEDQILTPVNSFGERALFVGFNSSFSVQSSSDYCIDNCIYYTDDLLEFYYLSDEGGGKDMGVYCLTSGQKIKDYYTGTSRFSIDTPPLWVETPTALIFPP